MSQSQPDRLDRIEATLEQVVQALNNQVAVNAELRSSVNSLINIANQHQENFMVLTNEIRTIRADMQEMRADMQEMQSEVRGLQTENRRILDRLENRDV
ncbi:hypothetical protein NIES4071_16730 [Calothrix sp. NIES-4071]|nr:hypothetical protein NIES4071_16730 [Calothrix sp. NIES-4071]BAZ56007.1 hypothetical protein NIES4105_16680 [Calothrix sp. NIES-4105]